MRSTPEQWEIIKRTHAGQFVGIVAGMGRNAGRWDTRLATKRTAQRHAAVLRTTDPDHLYTVEPA